MAASLQCTRFLRNFTRNPVQLNTLSRLLSYRNKNNKSYKSKNREKKNVAGDEKSLSYCQMLKQRQAEAEKSIIVHFTLGTKITDILNTVEKMGGTVKETFFYKVKNMGFVLFEFQDKQAVKRFHSNRIDLYRLLEFHQNESHRFHRNMPAFVSKDELMYVQFDIRLLDAAETLSDQIKTLHYYFGMRQQQKRCQFFVCHQVQEVVRQLYPGAVVLPFGSGATGFGLATGSDLDMVMVVDKPPEDVFIRKNLSLVVNRPDPRLDPETTYLKMAGNLLNVSAGIIDVQYILRARVPIIKFRHSFTGLECDLSCNQRTGSMTAQILYVMSQCDERFHPLVTVIKMWGRASGVTKAVPGRWFSSFMLNMLVVHFLQTRKQPVLPAVKDMYRPDVDQEQIYLLSTSLKESFLKEVSEFPKSQNNQNEGDLLLEFFKYYSDFDFQKYTIDIHNGKCTATPGEDCIRIVNPCDKEHNICKNVNQENLTLFQEQCKVALQSLETKVNKHNNSSWGLSYVVNPAFGSRQYPSENLGSTQINIADLYEEEEISAQTENFEEEMNKSTR